MNTKSSMWRDISHMVQFLWQGTRAKAWWIVVVGIVLLTVVVLFAGYKSAPGVQGSGARAGTTSAAFSTVGAPALSSSPQQSSTTTNGPAQASVAQATQTQASQAQALKSAASTQSGQRLVIETANFDLTTSNLSKAGNQISQMTTQSGGFVQAMQQSTEQQGQSLETLTIRVPANRFESVLGRVKSLGVVNNFSQTGRDVTLQHNDLQEQLTQLQNEAQAYTRLFNKATSMSDMLQIQQSLTQVNSQIAGLNNQLHNLDRSVQFATLNIILHSSLIPIHQGSAPAWAPFIQSIHFMTRVGKGLFRVFAWGLPWAVLAGVVIGGVHVTRRRRQHVAGGANGGSAGNSNEK